MKPNLLLIPCFILICGFTDLQHGSFKSPYNDGLENKANTILLAKRNVIKLYPNPSYNGTITISTTLTDTLHFYIFDLDGTLINQTILTSKEKKTVRNLKKGTYLYDVFQNDESIEEGKIIVK